MYVDTTIEQIADYEIISDEAFKASGYINPEGFIAKDYGHDISLKELFRSADGVHSFINKSLKILGFSDLKIADYLESQAKEMFERFDVDQLTCRFDLTLSNKCKKFHVDTVQMRSITTLIGPGTELQFDDDEQIYQVETGDTLLIKGKLFSGGNQTVKHRSPAIVGTGIGRLVFVMDY